MLLGILELFVLLAMVFVVPSGQALAGTQKPVLVQAAPPPGEAWICAPGRVEPVSEEMRLGFDMPGRIREVLVEEGERVTRGQILARLVDDDYLARVAAAEAVLLAREARYRRVLAGSRSMEREEARAVLAEAEAVLHNDRIEYERRQRLVSQKVVAKEEADRAERSFHVARQKAEQARQRFRLVDDPAREEDVKIAEAELAEARARLAEAKALAEKAVLRAPLDGVALRKHRKSGEMVSVSYDTPVVTVGDISTLHVRADVDEKDVARVAVGQKAYMLADAYGDKRFWGKVIRVARILGKKNIRTDDPAEKNDTKILETLIDIEDSVPLPVGLRVDVFIQVGDHRR